MCVMLFQVHYELYKFQWLKEGYSLISCTFVYIGYDCNLSRKNYLRGQQPIEVSLYRNQHNSLRRTVMTIFFIFLRMELNYLSNDIILCFFVVVVYTLYRWTSQI